jgi:alpha-L-rhamnosidase
LWKIIRDQFGPKRQEAGILPEIHPANSFIGNMLRVEILSREGRSRQILDESIDYLLYMAERTGTLWEHTGSTASCNHGFASHIVHTLYRDVLGLAAVDIPGRAVEVRFNELKLESCQGRIPTPQGFIELAWRKENGRLRYRLGLPLGYTARIDNRSRLELAPEIMG